jgi:hypothetical protein
LKVKTFKNSHTSTTEDILYAKSYKAVEDKRAQLFNYTQDLTDSINEIKKHLSEREYIESNSDSCKIE